MKFLKLSFDYIKKNFLLLLIFAIIPTIFFGFLLRPFNLFEFICDYSKINVKSFASLFNSLFSFNFWHILLVLLGLVILSICMAMCFGQIENHMRSGKKNLKNSPAFLNNNFLVVLVNLLIIFMLWFVLQFLYIAVVCLVHIIFSGLNNLPNLFCIIFAILLSAVVFVLFIQICAIFCLNIPNMIINGYPAKQAFSNSIKLLNKNNFSFLLSLLLPFVIIIPLTCLLSAKLMFIANMVGVLILCVYVPALTMTGYFELTNTNRYDNRKYYNYNY